MLAPRGSLRIFSSAGHAQNGAIESQQFGQRPGLKRATAGRVRSVRIGNLRDVTEPGRVQMFHEGGDEARPGFALHLIAAAVHAHPGFDESPDEPRPYSALMIDAVAIVDTAIVFRRVARFLWRE